MEKHPNLKYLDEAIFHRKISIYKNSINLLSEDEYKIVLEFCCRLSYYYKLYGYGVIASFHWNCGHIFAEAIKKDKDCVFCSKID